MYGAPYAEKDRCPFFTKMGACRHGDRCTKLHAKPQASPTVLLPLMYPNPKIVPLQTETKHGRTITLEYSSRFLKQHAVNFFVGVWHTMMEFGPIAEMLVVDNLCDHLLGNVYIRYMQEVHASAAVAGLSGKTYDNILLLPELSPVFDFTDACCKESREDKCQRGLMCNFLHIIRVPSHVYHELEEAQQALYRNVHLPPPSSAALLGSAGGAALAIDGGGGTHPSSTQVGDNNKTLESAPPTSDEEAMARMVARSDRHPHSRHHHHRRRRTHDGRHGHGHHHSRHHATTDPRDSHSHHSHRHKHHTHKTHHQQQQPTNKHTSTSHKTTSHKGASSASHHRHKHHRHRHSRYVSEEENGVVMDNAVPPPPAVASSHEPRTTASSRGDAHNAPSPSKHASTGPGAVTHSTADTSVKQKTHSTTKEDKAAGGLGKRRHHRSSLEHYHTHGHHTRHRHHEQQPDQPHSESSAVSEEAEESAVLAASGALSDGSTRNKVLLERAHRETANRTSTAHSTAAGTIHSTTTNELTKPHRAVTASSQRRTTIGTDSPPHSAHQHTSALASHTDTHIATNTMTWEARDMAAPESHSMRDHHRPHTHGMGVTGDAAAPFSSSPAVPSTSRREDSWGSRAPPPPSTGPSAWVSSRDAPPSRHFASRPRSPRSREDRDADGPPPPSHASYGSHPYHGPPPPHAYYEGQPPPGERRRPRSPAPMDARGYSPPRQYAPRAEYYGRRDGGAIEDHHRGDHPMRHAHHASRYEPDAPLPPRGYGGGGPPPHRHSPPRSYGGGAPPPPSSRAPPRGDEGINAPYGGPPYRHSCGGGPPYPTSSSMPSSMRRMGPPNDNIGRSGPVSDGGALYQDEEEMPIGGPDRWSSSGGARRRYQNPSHGPQQQYLPPPSRGAHTRSFGPTGGPSAPPSSTTRVSSDAHCSGTGDNTNDGPRRVGNNPLPASTPSPGPVAAAEVRICHSCGQVGHTQRDCPENHIEKPREGAEEVTGEPNESDKPDA